MPGHLTSRIAADAGATRWRWGAGLALCGAFLISSWSIATAATGAPEEQLNRKVVLASYEAGLNRKDFDEAARYIGPVYIQHNPTAKYGRDGFRQFVGCLRRKHPNAHNTIVRVIAEGNFVMLHVHEMLDPGDRETAIVDIYRLERGKMIEHWDVKQSVPERDANGDGMFGPNRPDAGK